MGAPVRDRFHFVRPPLAVYTGSPVAASACHNAHRVLLTAAASAGGVLA
ncbi:hypothetical protein ACQEVF_06190 [Nonomuraea polychroma]